MGLRVVGAVENKSAIVANVSKNAYCSDHMKFLKSQCLSALSLVTLCSVSVSSLFLSVSNRGKSDSDIITANYKKV